MDRRKVKKETTFGDEVLHGLNDFLQSVEKGKPITVRTVKLNLEPGKYGPGEVKATRNLLGMSQAIFAQLLGVSTKTLQSWEQGNREVPGPARRLLDDFQGNSRHWVKVINKAMKEQLAHTLRAS